MIENCLFNDTEGWGYISFYGFDNEVFNNTFASWHEINIGLIGQTSINITIYGNAFINSTDLYDFGTTNYWDNGTRGNYYSDYSKRYPAATCIDGVTMDIPYYICSRASDMHPLANPPGWNAAPQAWSIGANATNITSRKDVQFSFAGSCGSHPAAFHWDFGDGTNATGVNPTHNYVFPGSYNVTLTITDADGQNSTLSRTGMVFVQDFFPVATFTAKPWFGGSIAYPMDPIEFRFTGSAGDTPATLSWAFGDGSNAINTTTGLHQYAAAGTYTITLTITDHDGDVRTAQVQVVITERPRSPEDVARDWFIGITLTFLGIVALAGLLHVTRDWRQKKANRVPSA